MEDNSRCFTTYFLISASKVSLVPFEYLTESHFLFLAVHHAAIVVLQEGLGCCEELAVNVLVEHITLDSVQMTVSQLSPTHTQLNVVWYCKTTTGVSGIH